MTTIKTKDLTGAALDWAVAKAHFTDGRAILPHFGHSVVVETGPGSGFQFRFYPSVNPNDAWPIIESEGISIRKIVTPPFAVFEKRHYDASKGDEIFRPDGFNRDMVRRPNPPHKHEGWWLAKMPIGTGSNDSWRLEHSLSPTSLIAGMRCYVATELGDEVDVPDELLAATEAA